MEKEKKVKYGYFYDEENTVTYWYGDKGVVIFKKVKAWKNPQGYYIQYPFVKMLIRIAWFFYWIVGKRGHIDI